MIILDKINWGEDLDEWGKDSGQKQAYFLLNKVFRYILTKKLESIPRNLQNKLEKLPCANPFQ